MKNVNHRRRLVPKSTIIAVAVIAAVLASAAGAAVLVARAQRVDVPDLVGLKASVAEVELKRAGLAYEVIGTRVSVDVPEGHVITQEPSAGSLVTSGDTVGVVLSVGPQTFAVPDLIGEPTDDARQRLLAMGLDVVVVSVSSETTEAVVLEMFPAPGATVSAGDEVRLSVPGGSDEPDALLPYDLTGLTILLDPSPDRLPGGLDPAGEVARRLQALFEAAGATVALSRAPGDSAPTGPAELPSTGSQAALLVALDVGASGTPGFAVAYLPGDASSIAAEDSLEIALAITKAATLPGLTVNQPFPSVASSGSPFADTEVRVTIGDSQADADVARFSDPVWADQVARAIYRGVGSTLERK